MPADLLIDRAGIETSAAANTRERLPCDGTSQHPRTAVVEYNDVQLVWAFILRLALQSGDKRLVTAQTLASAGPWQQFQKDIQNRKAWQNFFDAHDCDMDSRQARS